MDLIEGPIDGMLVEDYAKLREKAECYKQLDLSGNFTLTYTSFSMIGGGTYKLTISGNKASIEYTEEESQLRLREGLEKINITFDDTIPEDTWSERRPFVEIIRETLLKELAVYTDENALRDSFFMISNVISDPPVNSGITIIDAKGNKLQDGFDKTYYDAHIKTKPREEIFDNNYPEDFEFESSIDLDDFFSWLTHLPKFDPDYHYRVMYLLTEGNELAIYTVEQEYDEIDKIPAYAQLYFEDIGILTRLVGVKKYSEVPELDRQLKDLSSDQFTIIPRNVNVAQRSSNLHPTLFENAIIDNYLATHDKTYRPAINGLLFIDSEPEEALVQRLQDYDFAAKNNGRNARERDANFIYLELSLYALRHTYRGGEVFKRKSFNYAVQKIMSNMSRNLPMRNERSKTKIIK
ncbi:MAG: hypothetical protein LBM27_05670 [Lactobacillaceae bacterium]|jgi:hypothetical protein|nr:hypothetical protein [Lactobacillaceae bacterium]